MWQAGPQLHFLCLHLSVLCDLFNNFTSLLPPPLFLPLLPPDLLSSPPQTLWALPVRTRRRSWPTSLASTTPSQAPRRYPGCSVSFLLLFLTPLLLCVCPNSALLFLQCTTSPCRGHSPSLSAWFTPPNAWWDDRLCSFEGNERKCISSLPRGDGAAWHHNHSWLGFCSSEQKLSGVGGAAESAW